MLIFIATVLPAQDRQVIEINKNWTFIDKGLPVEKVSSAYDGWQAVDIPHTWNNREIQSGDTVNYGTAWYKKILDPGIPQAGRQYFLRFEGVGQYAVLYVNRKYVGEHLGSYSAFAFNITRFLEPDTANVITVKVNNELNASYPKDNFLFGIYGGIYRNVNLIITENTHIGITDHASSGVYVSPVKIDNDLAILSVKTLLKNDGATKQLVQIKNTLEDNEGKICASNIMTSDLFPGGPVPVVMSLTAEKPHLWNGLKDPYLYRLTTELIMDGKVIDKVSQPYGIRYFSVEPDKGFILNGEPYRLYGVCRHQEWQDVGNALLPEHHRKDMELIHELGATSIRLAHYQQAEYFYTLADSIGFLVWAEIPFVNGFREGADGNAMQQMAELIKQNYNHPSIFVWGVHNEVIKGQDIARPVNLSRELHMLAKDLDPNRYTVSVSNIWWVYDHPIHENTDLQGFNQYTGWYGGKPENLAGWITKYHQARPDVRFSVSEYGAGANIAQQSLNDTSVPNPTGQFFPEGYQTHYHEVTWMAIEASPFIWASYVWNMFDFSVPEWDRGGIRGRNHKGLVTYDRKIKKDAFFWYKANWSEEAVLYLAGKRNDTVSADKIRFKAYCNFNTPELFIDGNSMGLMKTGKNEVQFLSDHITLSHGKHFVEIRANKHEMIMRDAFYLFVVM